MQKFLSLLFSRRALAVVGVLVLALLVWFVGPLVSFDTLRPLASVGSRVVTIALLLMLLVLWLVNWSMSIIGISVLCLAIGFVTPLLALGDVHPFAPLWGRLTLIGFILLMYALYGLYRLWRALRMDEQLLRRFLHPRGEEVPVAGEIKADLRTVNHIVTQAIRQLRQLRVDMPGWRKIFEGKRFLYELPWFMVVGSPGDGKTTALLNTGLQFPLAEQMEQTSRILTVPGGGTLHCDWWFTNEAVLIDTAGRYARHDDGGEVSAAQRNAGEWQGFLGLLRKHRPGAPLNGVILTLNVADLTAQSPAERLAACAALRARLADLRETLGIRFPVYLVVTKMDLLPGFSDYFRTLTSHLRAQIWGFSLPYSRRRKAGDPQALHAACAQELARLTLRLDQGLDTRLQEEYDLKSRQRLYTFPREFAALGEPLLEAIEQIFLDSKFDATQLNNTLRGVFFTSAAQAQADAVADQLSIWQRFVRAIKTARGEFRPQRTVSKPHTKGPQSAIVTGPAGQEIWTDQYGRVKVQFGWDRYGKMDENSSCWIRVSYPWAGKGFGMIQIPRIGQEVLVDFKNGDPDLPIIVGRTYNQDTMPPWGLPGMASQSGIFSHSLYGGPTNGNMLRFDDKTGAEEVKFHAEKDLNTTVKNNETHTVMVDRTKTIIKNETNSIGEDRNTTVTKNDGLSVKLAQTINIGTTYRLDVGDQFTLRCGNAALVLHKDGSIEFCGKQLMLHTSDVMQLIGKGIDMNPDGGTAVTADDIAPLPTSE
ncbi:type VI secretion system membrane subunit TssM [Salmonella enterica]|nr:type VI secretion system membrane subunit TssM [Salmonella enterica]EBR0769198.1 type VI secretion system membrane subunit TssM [Salmonella enterica]